MKKKIIGSVLATAMTISMLPMVTSAAGGAISETDGETHFFPGNEYDFLEITGGVYADNDSVVHANADIVNQSGIGVEVGENGYLGAFVNAMYNVTASAEGIKADGKGSVKVYGNVTATETAAYALGNSFIHIDGSADGSYGVFAIENANVWVGGLVTGTSVNGVTAFDTSYVELGDDIVGAADGIYVSGAMVKAQGNVTGNCGASAADGGSISIGKTVTGNGNFAAMVSGSGKITVGGDAVGSTGSEGVVYANGDKVEDAAIILIDGNVLGDDYGIYAIDGGYVVVGEDVIADEAIDAFGSKVIVKGSVEGGLIADEGSAVTVGGDAAGDITVSDTDTVVIIEGIHTGGIYNSTSVPGAKVYIGEFSGNAITGEPDVFYLIGLADSSVQWSDLTIVTNTLIPDMTEINGVDKSYFATLNIDDVAGKEISFKSADASKAVAIDPDTLPAGVTMSTSNGVITLKFDSAFKGGLQDLNITNGMPEYKIVNGTPDTDKATNNGYIMIDKTTAAKGETVTVTVKANDGYLLDGVPSYTLGGTKYEGKQGASADEYVFEMPEADIEIKASFVAEPLEKYEVSFVMNGHGDAIDPQIVEEGKTASKPKDPSASEWIFDGWYADSQLKTAFDFDSKIAQDTVVYAKWSAAITYKAENSEPLSWEKGSSEPLNFVFHRSENDATTYQNFVQAGEKAEISKQAKGEFTPFVALSGATMRYHTGSLHLSILPFFLETLPAGKYKLTVYFTDGSASAEFEIKLAPAPKPGPDGTPKTGDTGIMIYVVGMVVSAGAIGALVLTGKRRKRSETDS